MYDIKKTILAFIRQNRKAMGLYLILSLSSPIAEVLLPKYYGEIIDDISRWKKARFSPMNASTKRTITTIIVLWGVLQVLYQALDRLDAKMIPKLQGFVRKHIVLDVIETFKDNHQEVEIGDLLAKIVKLPLVIRDLAHQIRHFILPTFLVVLAVAGYLFYIDPRLGAVFSANIAAIVGAIVWLGRTCTARSETMNERDNKLHEEIADVLSNILNVYAADSLDSELERLANRQRELEVEYKQTINCASRFKLMYNALSFILFLSVNGMTFYLFSQKKLTLPQVITTFIITLFLVENLNKLGGEIRDFVFNVGMTRNMQAYLDRLRALKPPTASATVEFQIVRGDLDFKDVSVSLDGHRVLNKVSLRVPAGQKIAIVGQNGSGKSTLIKTLMKLKSYSGVIAIDGHDIRPLDPNKLRKQIVYVPQHPQLFNRTIYDNITYGIQGITKKDVRALLEQFGLSTVLGHDLDQPVGKNGERLSGGQKQIVFLLRCVLRCTHPGKHGVPPSLVILDEPTSALDEANKVHIFAILDAIVQGRTVVMITHDPYLLKFADQVVRLDAGEIAK